MVMNTLDIVRAWTDEEYRRSLDPSDLEQLPEHPAGEITLTDADINVISGNDPKLIEFFTHDCSGSCSDTTYCLSTGPCCHTEATFTAGPCC
jgi:mersacidin/lichenicidin family type 2 lantibiotic